MGQWHWIASHMKVQRQKDLFISACQASQCKHMPPSSAHGLPKIAHLTSASCAAQVKGSLSCILSLLKGSQKAKL